MDSVPQLPDQQTRNAVTARIIAHATAGWPRSKRSVLKAPLGHLLEPLV